MDNLLERRLSLTPFSPPSLLSLSASVPCLTIFAPSSQDFILSKAKSDIEAIRAAAPGDMERLIAASTKCFPFKSATEASEAFKSQLDVSSADNKGNDAVSGALFVVRDEITAAIEKIMTIERFIALSTPPMEDGNNFGVTVQMMVAKFSKDVRDDLAKVLDSLPGYFDARAGAYEKVRWGHLAIQKLSCCS